jgi:hypothetical protein
MLTEVLETYNCQVLLLKVWLHKYIYIRKKVHNVIDAYWICNIITKENVLNVINYFRPLTLVRKLSFMINIISNNEIDKEKRLYVYTILYTDMICMMQDFFI